MSNPTVAYVLSLLMAYGYWIIFPISIIEGPVIAMVAGFLASLSDFNFWVMYGVLMAGDIVGDALFWAAGYWGREKLLMRWGKYVGLLPERVHAFESHFLRHDWKLLLLGKLNALGGAVLFAAGAARMPFWRYMWYNTLGSLPKVLLLEATGYYFGQSFSALEGYLNEAALLSLAIPAALWLAYVLLKRWVNARVKE